MKEVIVAWALANLGPYVWGLALTLVFLIAGGVIHLMVLAVKNQKASKLKHYTLALAAAAQRGVKFAEQTLRPQLPEHLNEEDAKKLKDAALAVALNYLKNLGLSDLKSTLGMTDEALLKELGVEVEVAVQGQVTLPEDKGRSIVTRPSGEGKVVVPNK